MAEVIFRTPDWDSEGGATSSQGLVVEYAAVKPTEVGVEASWYAVRTRSRHEKVVDKQFRDQEIVSFLPVMKQVHRWSDRRKVVESPLFSGYIFVRVAPSPGSRMKVLRTHGVVSFVGTQGYPLPIPEEQIEAVRRLVTNEIPFTKHHFLKVGQRVRIRGGALDGVEGILVGQHGNRNLVISVEPIQRSLSVHIEGYQVEPA